MIKTICCLLSILLLSIAASAQNIGRIFSWASRVTTVIDVPVYLLDNEAINISHHPNDFAIEIGGTAWPTLWRSIIFKNNNGLTGVIASVYVDGNLAMDSGYRVVKARIPLPPISINPAMGELITQNNLCIKIDSFEVSIKLFNPNELTLPIESRFTNINQVSLPGGLAAITYTTLYTIDSVPFIKVRLHIRNECGVAPGFGRRVMANPYKIDELRIGMSGPIPYLMGIKNPIEKDVKYNFLTNDYTLMRDGYVAPIQGMVYDLVICPFGLTPAQYEMAYLSYADKITACPNADLMNRAGLFTPIAGPYPASKTFADGQRFINSYKDSFHDYGPFCSFGDTLNSGQAGTPRNKLGTQWAKYLIQTEYSQIIPALEMFCLGQAARPMLRTLNDLSAEQKDELYAFNCMPHFTTTDEWRIHGIDPMSEHPFGPPIPGVFDYSEYNGWNGADYEHWHNTDIFLYYMLTGDQWAFQELESYGTNLMFLLKFPPSQIYTRYVMAERSEGWTMIGAKYILMAIKGISPMAQDLENHMRSRINHVKNTINSWDQYGSDVLAQFGDARRWPRSTHYSVTWQVGALSLGFAFWEERDFAMKVIKRVKDRALDPNGIPYQYYDLDGRLPGIPNGDDIAIFILPACCYAHTLAPGDGFNLLVNRILNGRNNPDVEFRNFFDWLYMVN